MRPTCSLEKLCPPPKKKFSSRCQKVALRSSLPLHLALGKKKLFICRADVQTAQPPDNTLGFQSSVPGAPGVSGRGAQRRGAAVPNPRGTASSSSSSSSSRSSARAAGHAVSRRRLRARSFACPTRDAPHPPPKRVPEQSRDGGRTGGKGEGRGIGFGRSRQRLKRPVALGELLLSWETGLKENKLC